MKFDDVRKLHQRKHREALGYFLVEGEHPVLELQKAAADNPLLNASELFVTKEHADWRGPFQTRVISGVQMSQISDTRTPQGIVAVAPLLPATPARPGEKAIYLREVQDPGNLGTILRSLAWFGNLRCLLSPGSVDPYNPKVVRASMGALFHVPLEQHVDVTLLAKRYRRFACLDMTGEPVRSGQFRDFDCYVFGNEARGVPPELASSLGAKAFTIPGSGNMESLNLASAVNICVYELTS
jgi:TrmH family RNA methyltransferase